MPPPWAKTKQCASPSGICALLLHRPNGTLRSPLAEDITFVSQGGAYQEAQSKTILEPAARKLGLTLKQDSSPKAYPMIKTQVESGNVSWDVVDLPTGDCIRGEQEGLFEKLDLTLIPNAAQLPAELKDDYSVGYISYSTVMAYRTDAFKGDKVPKAWADFWNTQRFPGQRSLRNLPRPTLEIALMADGVAPKDVYTAACPGMHAERTSVHYSP